MHTNSQGCIRSPQIKWHTVSRCIFDIVHYRNAHTIRQLTATLTCHGTKPGRLDTEGHRVNLLPNSYTCTNTRCTSIHTNSHLCLRSGRGSKRGANGPLGNETPPVGDFLVRVWKVGGEEATLHQPLHGGGLWYRCTSQVYFTYILKYNPPFAYRAYLNHKY